MSSEGRGPGGINSGSVEYYADGAWYDAEYVHIRYDIPYYVRVATETPGRILELACGTGRLTIPMAEAGGEVLGTDVSPGMIARANAKRESLPKGDKARLNFSVEDMRSMRLGERFQAVVLAFNTLMHMIDDEDLAGTFDTAREHLAPDGLFHLDLHTPFPDAQDRDPDGRFDPQELIEPRTRHRYIVTENSSYAPRTQINSMYFYYQRVDLESQPIGPERCSTLELRVIFPRELDRWLHLHGFEVLGDWEDFSDHDRSPVPEGVG